VSEYDTWAPVYDAWASDLTGDVAHYVSLAREADGPIVELMVGSGRVATEVDSRIEIERDGAATLRLWWATKSEWDGLLEVAGLEVEALYGGFEREPFGDESLEFVYVTRRP
jgi:hypothetical protein